MNVADSYQISTQPVRTKRIDELYRYITSSKYGICVERAKYLTEYCRSHTDEVKIINRARAIDYVLQHMSIYLMPGSLFAEIRHPAPDGPLCSRNVKRNGWKKSFCLEILIFRIRDRRTNIF